MPPVIFSHGNSFPASTYRVMLDSLRNRGFSVDAIEKFGHDPKYPVTDNWPHLVDQLGDFAKSAADKAHGPVFLVGHSLGGFLSLMCAARNPELAQGVVLLDSPLIGGWRADTLNIVKRTPLMKSMSPSLVSRNRRNSWADREAVFAHFRSKKAFARWDEQVLHDYIDHDNPYYTMMHNNWGLKLREVFDSIEDPVWDDAHTDTPLKMPAVRHAPLKKITSPAEKLI